MGLSLQLHRLMWLNGQERVVLQQTLADKEFGKAGARELYKKLAYNISLENLNT